MVDPRAAGDAFIGAFCTRICTDDSIGKVLTIANYTAALSIATEGAIESLPTSKQVREYMEQKRCIKCIFLLLEQYTYLEIIPG